MKNEHSERDLSSTAVGVAATRARRCRRHLGRELYRQVRRGRIHAATSQSGQFAFKIEAHTSADHCATSASSHCFIAITYPTYTEPRHGGQSLTESFSVPIGFVSAQGRFSYHQALNGTQEPLIQFQARASGSKVTGTFREEDETVNGTTTTLCDTGIVPWTAHRARP
jgi:hypothetical protein